MLTSRLQERKLQASKTNNCCTHPPTHNAPTRSGSSTCLEMSYWLYKQALDWFHGKYLFVFIEAHGMFWRGSERTCLHVRVSLVYLTGQSYLIRPVEVIKRSSEVMTDSFAVSTSGITRKNLINQSLLLFVRNCNNQLVSWSQSIDPYYIQSAPHWPSIKTSHLYWSPIKDDQAAPESPPLQLIHGYLSCICLKARCAPSPHPTIWCGGCWGRGR